MEKKKNMFERDLERGKRGEKIVKKYLELKGCVVEDVSDNPEYQGKDIDFLVNGKTVELKTDYIIHKSNNLFLETRYYYTKDTPHVKAHTVVKGYLGTSEAEYLAYYDIVWDRLYIYKFDDIKNYVINMYKTIPLRVCNDGYKRVEGYCLNKYRVQPVFQDVCVSQQEE